jgi:hypothetical protein
MSTAFDHFCLIVLFIIPKAVELSILNGVAGCVCSNSVRVNLSGALLSAFLKHAPNSDYDSYASTFLMTTDTLRIESLSLSI